MRGSERGLAPPQDRCAPRHTAQHGRGGGQSAGRIDLVDVLSLSALVGSAPIRRLWFHALILPLSAMSAHDKLDAFPGERPLASDVLEWTRVNKPRLSADFRAIADGYTPRSLLA